jgi:Tol biopolymer transport system component
VDDEKDWRFVVYRRVWVIAVLFGMSAVLSVCLSACAGAGAPSVPPIDDGAGPARITVRFDMSMGADASARGVTPVVNGVQLESDPLSMNWDGSVLSGDVRVNNVSTGSTMTDIEARIFSVNPPDVGIGWNDQEWNYKSAAEGLSSRFVNWAFSGSGGADFEFVVEVSWTPVPAKIAWVTERHGNKEVYVANRDGTNPVNVSNCPGAEDDSPSLSADGSKIAWRSIRDGNQEVYVANTDGTEPVKVGDGGSPSLSADGSKIAWFNANSVWVANTNGPGGVEIAEGLTPSLSADGSKVAWVSYLHGDFEVYVANADGTDVVNVSDDEGYNDQPSLSADGSKVAWQSNRSGDWEVYVASTDGTGLAVNVSNDSDANDYSPSLSADGSKVAWVSNCGGDWEVYVASTDGTGEIVNVSKDPDGGNDSPSLSADGRTVAWQGWPEHSSGYEVRLANSDGTGVIVDVTDSPAFDRYPSLQGN